jgi:hypothetical protein
MIFEHQSKNRKFLLIIATIVFIGGIFYLVWPNASHNPEPIVCTEEAKLCIDGSVVGRSGPDCAFAPCPKEDLIQVENLNAYEKISSPLVIRGQARGYWFFEASFPIKLFDANGELLSVAIAQADGDWMTEDFVPFEVELSFNLPTTKTGIIVLEKDNPSGLPEHADELRIPIEF